MRETFFTFDFCTSDFDKAGFQCHPSLIKPAAPLLACVIRRVFFYLDEAMIVPKGAAV